MGNWWEERELMEATGVARTEQAQHIQKNRKDLFLKPPSENEQIYKANKQPDTHDRTLGEKYNDIPNSENYSTYGKGNEISMRREDR